jgi:hypothetical protein
MTQQLAQRNCAFIGMYKLRPDTGNRFIQLQFALGHQLQNTERNQPFACRKNIDERILAPLNLLQPRQFIAALPSPNIHHQFTAMYKRQTGTLLALGKISGKDIDKLLPLWQPLAVYCHRSISLKRIFGKKVARILPVPEVRIGSLFPVSRHHEQR